MSKTDVLGYRLPTREADAFRLLARERGLPMSVVIRQLIADPVRGA